MLKVAEIKIYPVKSLQGISLNSAELGIRGLKFDHNWMVTDSEYNFVTQRDLPKMAAISTAVDKRTLTLEHGSLSPLIVDLSNNKGNPVEAVIWNDRSKAVDEGDCASNWLTEVLGRIKGRNLRIVRFSDQHRREVDKKYLKGEDSHTAFSDAFPYLVTTEESLELLNEMLIANGSKPVGMERFRPNLVLKGAKALEENKFDSITELNYKYRLGIRKPCKRCVITTIDQTTTNIAEPKEPLRTLLQMNPYLDLRGAFFGQNATLISGVGETISIGDILDYSFKV